jgi:hypothetical protein
MSTAENRDRAVAFAHVSDASAAASYAWALHELGDAAGARDVAIDAAAAWLEDPSDLSERQLVELLDAVDGDGRALLAMVRVASVLAPRRVASP